MRISDWSSDVCSADLLRLRLGAHLWAPFRPRTSAQPSMKPLSVLNISGSSSRKASWPLSVSISTKLTLAAAALSARTISLFSGVGNSQSDVDETTQKRVFEQIGRAHV